MRNLTSCTHFSEVQGLSVRKKKTTLNLIKVCSIQKSVPRNRGVTITPAGKDYSMSAVKLLLMCIAVVITNI